MANLPLGSLTLDLVANTARLAQGLDRAQAQMAKFQERVSAVASAFGRFAGAYLTFQALSGAINMVQQSFDRLGGLGEIGMQIGATVEQVQALQAVAVGAGIEAGQMEQSFGRLSGAIGEAMAGSEEAEQKFARLGVAFRDVNGNARDTWSVFEDVARRVSEAASETDALRIAAEAFGERGGRRMVPLLREVADHSGTTVERMRDMGQVLSKDLSDAADKAGDAMAAFGRLVLNVLDATLARMGPLVEAIMAKLTSITLEVARFLGILDRPIEQQRQRVQRDIDAARQTMGRQADMGNAAQQELNRLNAELERFEGRSQETLTAADRRLMGQLRAQRSAAQERLEFNRETLDALSEELTDLDRRMQELAPVTVTPPPAAAPPAVRPSAAATRAANEAQREFNQLLQEAQRLYERAREPAQQFNDAMNRVAELAQRGAFRPEMGGFQAAFAAAGQAAQEFVEGVTKAGQDPVTALDTIRERLVQLSESLRNSGATAQEAAAGMTIAWNGVMEPLRDMARQIYENTRTPMEELERAATRIQGLFRAGAFESLGGGETAMRGIADAAGRAAASIDQLGGNTDPIFDRMRTAIRAVADEMIRTGQLTEEQFPAFMDRAMRRAGEAMQNSPFQTQVRAIREATDTIKSDIEEAFLDLSGNVMDTVNNLLESVLKAFQRMAYRTFLEPAMSSLLKGFSGFLQGFLPGSGAAGSAHGNVFENHRMVSFAHGGKVSNVVPFAQGGVVSRASLFPMAAIAEAGRPEAIIPLFRGSNGDLGVKAAIQGGPSPVTVNVYNNSDNNVRTESRDGLNGREIDVYIERTVERGIVDGRFDRSLGTSFGVRRSGVR